MSTDPEYFDFDAWLAAQPDEHVVALTIMGEARGEDRQGREMVASVVCNRVARAQAHAAQHNGARFWWGMTHREVCLKPWQFSCWLEKDPNRAKMPRFLSHRLWAEALEIARAAIEGRLVDQTGGADHYHVDGINPPWAKGREPSASHRHHVFYKIG